MLVAGGMSVWPSRLRRALSTWVNFACPPPTHQIHVTRDAGFIERRLVAVAPGHIREGLLAGAKVADAAVAESYQVSDRFTRAGDFVQRHR